MSSEIVKKNRNSDDDIPPHEWEEHNDQIHYIRDVILGMNDGLISIYLLVVGLVAAGRSNEEILFAAIAAAIAGAISMSIGEYLSTKSQEEVYQAEIERERLHIKHYREHELAELYELFEELGFDRETQEKVVGILDKDDDNLLRFMSLIEFGREPGEEKRVPYRAMVIIASVFLLGSLASIIPFLFLSINIWVGLAIASILTFIGLFAVGAIKTFQTNTSRIKAGGENLLLAAVGAVISSGIGFFVDFLV